MVTKTTSRDRLMKTSNYNNVSACIDGIAILIFLHWQWLTTRDGHSKYTNGRRNTIGGLIPVVMYATLNKPQLSVTLGVNLYLFVNAYSLAALCGLRPPLRVCAMSYVVYSCIKFIWLILHVNYIIYRKLFRFNYKVWMFNNYLNGKQ